jgi:hypothetical protein
MVLTVPAHLAQGRILDSDITDVAIYVNGVPHSVEVTGVVIMDSFFGVFDARVSVNYERFEFSQPPENSRNIMIYSSLVFKGTRVNSANNFATNAQGGVINVPTPTPVQPPRPVQPIKVFIDGSIMNFAVQPQMINNRVMLPVRGIFEAMGATVSWDDNSRTVTATKGDITVVLPIGSSSPTVNGIVQTIDQPGVVVSGSTLAPLRFVAEAFGGKVQWDDATP